MNLWLNFAGATVPEWAGWKDIVVPPCNLSHSIQDKIAAMVQGFFSEFDVNVLKVMPIVNVEAKGLVVHVGGDGDWTGTIAGGKSLMNQWINPILPKCLFVFSDRYGSKWVQVARCIAHECGHAFGLFHQAQWRNGKLIAEYNPGTAAKAPLMGQFGAAPTADWWIGPTPSGPKVIQNDRAMLRKVLGVKVLSADSGPDVFLPCGVE